MKDFKLLRVFYSAIAMLFLVLAMADILINDSAIKLDIELPENVIVFTTFFILPHILCSYYIGFSKTLDSNEHLIQRAQGIALTIAVYAILFAFSIQLFFLLYMAHGTYHLVMQQVGLTRFNGVGFTIYTIANLSLGFAIVVDSYIGYHFPYLMMIILLFLFYFYFKHRSNKFIIANIIVSKSMCLLSIMDYTILSLFLIRMVHDITALYFYSQHERNRKKISVNKAFILIYGFSVVINVIIYHSFKNSTTTILNNEISLYVLLSAFIAIGHYSLESKMWRKESPNRKYI